MQSLLELFGPPQWSLLEFHQASTHFPIGLLLGAALLDLGGSAFKNQSMKTAAFWAQMLGTLLLIVTLGAGYFGNPYGGKSNEIAQKANWHQNFAFVTTGFFVFLAIWRLGRHKKWSRFEAVFYALVTLLAVAIISITGWMGAHIAE